ncbi:MAG: hypothetical protein F4Y38_10960 [Gemmatimonadetes bacterium]|nr:hypothetical protein [Gemmatimonadota bacterium]MYG86612.1 hypothetical protein [Gemmatimonadota bacterium]MYJ88574.1 hypothetical protein [Gemmatimonadota bacterium]
MRIPDSILQIDRRIIFLLIGAAVCIPLLLKPRFQDSPTPIVQSIFDTVERLPSGSRVFLSFDYGPDTAPELDPMAKALVRHTMTRGHEVSFFTLFPEGVGQIKKITDNLLPVEFPDKAYGRDYVNLGYKAGLGGAINTMVVNFRTLVNADAEGTPLDDLPITADVDEMVDYVIILSLTAGDPGLKEWIQFAGDIAGIPVMGGGTAVVAPELYPYYPQQLVGLMGGLKGASEYESALVDRYPAYRNATMEATMRMGPQVVTHVLIVLLVLLGNLAYFFGRSGRAARAGRTGQGNRAVRRP